MLKLAIYLAIAVLLVGAAVKALSFSYGKGVADTEIAYQLELGSIRDEAAANAVKDYREAQAIAGAEIDTEIKIVTEIREIEREVIVYIDRIIKVKPECSNLPELGELFSRQAEAANLTAVRAGTDPG